jgi:hypothetical protein
VVVHTAFGSFWFWRNALAVLALVLVGCSSHVSPFVRNVRALPDGTIHVERCELTQNTAFSWAVDVDECKWSRLGDAGAP